MAVDKQTVDTHIEYLRGRLNALAERWSKGHLDFWDFIGAEGGIAARGAYNFAASTANARNSRLSTITGIERALDMAECVLARDEA